MGDPDIDEAHAQEDRQTGAQARLLARAEAAEVERDLLRAVVETLKVYLLAQQEFSATDDEPDLTERYNTMVGSWQRMRELLDQLDGSAEATDG